MFLRSDDDGKAKLAYCPYCRAVLMFRSLKASPAEHVKWHKHNHDTNTEHQKR